MKAERIAELRSAWPRGGGAMSECLDEIERLQAEAVDVPAWEDKFVSDEIECERLRTVAREVAAELRERIDRDPWLVVGRYDLHNWAARLEAAASPEPKPCAHHTLSGTEYVGQDKERRYRCAECREYVRPEQPEPVRAEDSGYQRCGRCGEGHAVSWDCIASPETERCNATWGKYRCRNSAGHSGLHREPQSTRSGGAGWDDLCADAKPHTPSSMEPLPIPVIKVDPADDAMVDGLLQKARAKSASRIDPMPEGVPELTWLHRELGKAIDDRDHLTKERDEARADAARFRDRSELRFDDLVRSHKAQDMIVSDLTIACDERDRLRTTVEQLRAELAKANANWAQRVANECEYSRGQMRQVEQLRDALREVAAWGQALNRATASSGYDIDGERRIAHLLEVCGVKHV